MYMREFILDVLRCPDEFVFIEDAFSQISEISHEHDFVLQAFFGKHLFESIQRLEVTLKAVLAQLCHLA